MAIIDYYPLAFFNRFVNDQDQALLDGPAARFPEVRLQEWRRPRMAK